MTTRDRPAVGRELRKVRQYTTASIVGVIAFYLALVAVPSVAGGELVFWTAVASAVVVTAHGLFWEDGPPWWLAAASLGVSWTHLWLVTLAGVYPPAGAAFSIAVALVVTTAPRLAWGWSVPAVVATAVPAIVVTARGGDTAHYVVVSIIATLFMIAFLRFNRWAYGLMQAVDTARGTAAELAVVQERYRFAADLHDIQGQALHVTRMQLQLADKMLDRDPEKARQHLREARDLVAQTIAETRSLAYGERTVTPAGEVANSRGLLEAAGIRCHIDGEPPSGHPLDQLLGLVVRETTTNILRHAQATEVRMSFAPASVTITNDGVTEHPRQLRGLARLADRLEAAGGVLTTGVGAGTFTTTAGAR
jgi:two-component system sensor histidine kinase DesK